MVKTKIQRAKYDKATAAVHYPGCPSCTKNVWKDCATPTSCHQDNKERYGSVESRRKENTSE